MNWRRQVVYCGLALLVVSPVAALQLLVFPYSKQIGSHRVYSEIEITPELDSIVAKADALASSSPIADPDPSQRFPDRGRLAVDLGGAEFACLRDFPARHGEHRAEPVECRF